MSNSAAGPGAADERDVFSWVGAIIADKYRVEAVIGEGGFGVVYRAFHLGLSTPVAVKCLKVPASLDVSARSQLEHSFVNEAKLLHELSRSNSAIVQALDVGSARAPSGDWTPYMVLELLHGRSLQALLDERRAAGLPRWTLAEALQLLQPVALALADAHEKRIAHRDLKPENMFLAELSGATTLKLLDFGIAKVFSENASLTAALKSTGSSMRAFTPQYGAPEQFDPRYGATGPWTDVFAFALVLSELLIGRPALNGQDTIQLMVAAANPGSRPTPRTLGVSVPQHVEDAIAHALAVEPAARYATLRQFWSALHQPTSDGLAHTELNPALQLGRPSAFVPVAPPRPRRRDRTWLSALVGPFALGLLVLCVYLALTRLASARRTHTLSSEPAPLLADSGRRSSLSAPSASLVLATRSQSSAEPARSAADVRVPQSSPVSVQHAVAERQADAVGLTPPAGMVYVPPGVFTMGGDRTPARRVTISRGFFIDWSEVAVSDYQHCVAAGVCTPSGVHGPAVKIAEYAKYQPMCNAAHEDRPTHPINCVDLGQAAAYCAFVGKRLPTEAEWEYAARGEDARRFPWGNEPPDCDHAVHAGCAHWSKNEAGTLPVGSRPDGASPFGASDMAGNVWEWVWDGWSEPQSEALVDPAVAASGSLGVVKGGSWDFGAAELAASHRLKFQRERVGVSVGVRCAAAGLARAPIKVAQGKPFDCQNACTVECVHFETCFEPCLADCTANAK